MFCNAHKYFLTTPFFTAPVVLNRPFVGPPGTTSASVEAYVEHIFLSWARRLADSPTDPHSPGMV